MNCELTEITEAHIKIMSRDDVYDFLRASMRIVGEAVVLWGQCILRLEELDEPTEDIRDFFGQYYEVCRKISCGQMVPELLVRYYNEPALADRLAKLPIPDQKRIAAGEGLPVVVKEGSKTTVQKIAPEHLGPMWKQVIAGDRVRSESEQAAKIAQQTAMKPAKTPDKILGRTLDIEREVVMFGREAVPFKELIEMVRRIKSLRKSALAQQ